MTLEDSTVNPEVLGTKKLIEKFVKVARVINQPGTVCGDGGVTREVATTSGSHIEVAGMAGDLGQDEATITAIMAFYQKHTHGYNPEELTNQVIDTYIKVHGKFHFHTAHHIHPPAKITDCGDMHGKMSPEFADAYQVNADDTRIVIQTAQKRAQTSSHGEVEEQDLGEREHHENAVLIVTGKTHSLIHWIRPDEQPGLDPDAVGMYFVLDPERAIERRKTVLEALQFNPEEVAEILNIKAAQDEITNSRLAAGKHAFSVNADQDTPEVNYLGQINQFGKIVN